MILDSCSQTCSLPAPICTELSCAAEIGEKNPGWRSESTAVNTLDVPPCQRVQEGRGTLDQGRHNWTLLLTTAAFVTTFTQMSPT